MRLKNTPRYLYPLCVLIAGALLLVCSKSSPLYPLNDWVDANIYFTIGKGLVHGYVPYLELYDQKGPFVYLLYGIASLISSRSFLGVYVLESLSFGGFLAIAYRIARLYAEKNILPLLPVLGALILSAMSVSHGGSLEEFCLPIFAYGLYCILRYFKQDYPANRPQLSMVAVNGLLAGLLLFSKFTLLAFYLGWMAMLFFAQCVRKDVKYGLICCGVFLAAMALTGVPWLIYFGVNKALPEFYYYYFYTNIFGYSTLEGPKALAMAVSILRGTAATLLRNAQYSLLIGAGLFYLTFGKKSGLTPMGKATLWAMGLLLCCGLYMGGQNYRYYGLTLAAFAPLGLIPLVQLLNGWAVPKFHRAIKNRPIPRYALAAGFTLLTGLCMCISALCTSNAYLLGVPKEETPQGRFAATMEAAHRDDSISLLCRAFPDSGFFLAADVMPINRFFTSNNVMLPEVAEEQTLLSEQAVPEFIITRNREDLPAPRYALLDTAALPYEEDVWTYRLYQRQPQ